MAPKTTSEEILIREEDTLKKLVAPQAEPRKFEIVWLNVAVFTYYHLAALYGLSLCFTSALWPTIAFGKSTYPLPIFFKS